MHPNAYEFVERTVAALGLGDAMLVADIGGRDINGTTRPLFPKATVWTVVDPQLPDGATGQDWSPTHTYDVVTCTEVFEHTADWPGICKAARNAEGTFIITAACNPRMKHSAIDEEPIREWEFYENVDPTKLGEVLGSLFGKVHVEHHEWGDVYAWAQP